MSAVDDGAARTSGPRGAQAVGSRRRLAGLYRPSSVVVVGASPSPEKWGYWLARGALRGKSGERPVRLVNEHREWVLGERTYRSLAELPEPCELAVIAVPARRLRPVVYDALEAGCRYLVVVTSDLPADWREEVVAALRARDARLLGPNCMGVVDHASRLHLTWGTFAPGGVGVVSQSGNLGLEIGRLLARAGAGVSRFVSLGDQWDVEAAEAVEDLAEDDATRVVALYVEGVVDGERFLEALARARRVGKPVVLLSVGRSEAAARAALSHTGALVSRTGVMEAVARATGAVRVATAGELVDVCLALLGGLAGGVGPAPVHDARSAERRGAWPPCRAKVAVLADGGGLAALAADACAAAGLDVPRLSGTTVQQVRRIVTRGASVDNPVDLAGAGEENLENYADLARLLARSEEVDAVLLTGYFGAYAEDIPGLEEDEVRAARRLAEVRAAGTAAIVVQTMARSGRAVEALREGAIPVYERIEQAAAGLAGLEKWLARGLERRTAASEQPARCRPVPGTVAERDRAATAADARALLERRGVAFPPALAVSTPEEARAAAARLGYPVVLKMAGGLHKTDVGGVVVGLEDDAALLSALREMQARTGARDVVVERMVTRPGAVEMLVGAWRDPSFGPLALLGSGGVAVEADADVAVALPPLDEEDLRSLVAELRLAPRLLGWRGAAPLDLRAVLAAVDALLEALDEDESILEVELNPLLVSRQGAIALDARVVRR